MDMMIHPDGIEMSTGGGMEGGEKEGKKTKKRAKIYIFFFFLGVVSARFHRFICLGSICRYNSYDMAPHSRILLLPFVPSRKKKLFSLTTKIIRKN